MPAQKLREWPGTARQVTPAPGTFQARVFVFGFTALLTAGGTYGMYQVISPVNVTSLQLLFAAIFALTFTWISFACASACLGFWAILMGRLPVPRISRHARMGRTALLMPVYNEDPEHIFAALERMGRSPAMAGCAAPLRYLHSQRHAPA